MKGLWTMGMLLVASVASAAVPPVIPFQGRITTADGTSPLQGAQTVIFTLYTTATGSPGDIVFTETQTVAFDQGAFSVSIGANSSLMTTIFKTHSQLYLGVHVGGDTQELRPLFKLGTVRGALGVE